MKNEPDVLVKSAVFSDDETSRADYRGEIRKLAASQGIYPAALSEHGIVAGRRGERRDRAPE